MPPTPVCLRCLAVWHVAMRARWSFDPPNQAGMEDAMAGDVAGDVVEVAEAEV